MNVVLVESTRDRFHVTKSFSFSLTGETSTTNGCYDSVLPVVQPVMHRDSDSCSRAGHNRLRPTTSVDLSLQGKFEGWTVLSRPALHRIAIQIYKSRGSPGSTNTLPVVCFYAHTSYSDTSRKPMHRTYLHCLQLLSGQDTLCITRLSILSSTIYSSSYSATIERTMRILGMTEWGGANSLMFVEDGVTSYTPRHST